MAVQSVFTGLIGKPVRFEWEPGVEQKTDGKPTLVQNLNVCITCFSLNEPSNPLLYYFYINTMYNMFYIVFVYFCMHVFLTSNARKVY